MSTPEVVNLKATPNMGGVTLTWLVTNTDYLVGFDIIIKKDVEVKERINNIPSGIRSYSYKTSETGLAFNVRCLVEVGGKTVVSGALPAPTPTPAPEPGSGVIFGVNDALGWGEPTTKALLNAGIKSARVEMGSGGGNTIQNAQSSGFSNNVVIVGNTSDGVPLSSVNIASWVTGTVAQIKEAISHGAILCEVGNEMYLKGETGSGAVKYGEMFLALHNSLVSSGIRSQVKLLINSFGGNWLKEIAQVTKNTVDGFTNHSYGKPGENSEDNRWGPGVVAPLNKEASQLGFTNYNNFYITEFGVLSPGSNGADQPVAASEEQKAQWTKEVYTELLGIGCVKGIWYYESHDEDSNHKFGLFDNNNNARPVLSTVSSFAKG